MKYTIGIVILFCSLSLMGWNKEFQGYLGTGWSFPSNIKTQDKTVIIDSNLQYPVINAYFGLTRDLDIGIHGSYLWMDDRYIESYINPDDPDEKGDLFFNYSRINMLLRVRYNILSGYRLTPHVIAGCGAIVQTYTDLELYAGKSKIGSYEKEDYAALKPTFQLGLDLQYRAWWKILLNVETLYNYAADNQSFEINATFGFNWFLKQNNVL